MENLILKESYHYMVAQLFCYDTIYKYNLQLKEKPVMKGEDKLRKKGKKQGALEMELKKTWHFERQKIGEDILGAKFLEKGGEKM